MNLSGSARRYFGAILLTTVFLCGAGVYSAMHMASGVYPEVTFPRVAIVARVPGLTVPAIEILVTQPLEQAVSTVIGVSQVRSKSIRGGSELSVDFFPGTNMVRAEQMTWNRIGSVRAQLPPDTELTVEQMTPSISPIMSVVLTGGADQAQLRDYAYYQLAPQLRNIPDVLYANVTGGDLREIEVEARPDDLLAAGLTAADLADQIGRAHRLEPIGRVEKPPFAFQLIINTQAESAHALEELVIGTKANQPLRVKDVASVRVSHQDRLMSVGYRGKDAVVVTIFRRLGGSTVDISRHIREWMAHNKPPRGIQATVAYDTATFVRTAVNNVRDAIIVGGLFSVLVLLMFLKSVRATLLSALAIPTTLSISFLFLKWAGETLNLMSLGGLAVAIGLIIDDTVVVVENISRHLAGGGPEHSPEVGPHSDANIDPVVAASAEITGAVVGSTLTTVLVFVPLAFIVGVYGQFFASLSWSLAIAVLISMVISLTVIPVCAARFLTGHRMPAPGPIYRFLERIYEGLLSAALRVPLLTVAGSLLAVVAGAVLLVGYPFPWMLGPGQTPNIIAPLQTGLMPNMDEGAFVVDIWAPSGTPLERTETMVRKVEDILTHHPDVEAYVRRAGAEMGLFATATNRGDIQVVLRAADDDLSSHLFKPLRPDLDATVKMIEDLRDQRLKAQPSADPGIVWEEAKQEIGRRYRRRPAQAVMDEIEGEIKEQFSEHQFKIELVQIMADELNDLSGASKPIEVKLFGPHYDQLAKLADKIGDALEAKGKPKGFTEVNSNVFDGNPDIMVQVDGIRSSQLGISVDEVERQLRAMYLGQVATQVRESALRITDVRVRYPQSERFRYGGFSPADLLDQLVLLPEGKGLSKAGDSMGSPSNGLARAVPLSALATLSRRRTTEQEWRENLQPVHFITAEINEDKIGLGESVKLVQGVMDGIHLPAGYHWKMGGHYLHQQEAFSSLLFTMVVAIFLVFLMLAFQFHSLLLPLLIFLTQPLSLVAGLLALWVARIPLNISSYMGAILLIGLDMKNGILLVEYIQDLLAGGMELKPALLLAGRTRFRPILMTSLAAILGLAPLALGLGPGAQMQQPLAVMVIGGLTANMLFTRVVIPAGYLLLARFIEH